MDMETLARNWWAIAIRGVAAIAFGVLAFALPGLTLATMVLLFGAYALVDGIFTLIAAARGGSDDQPWWALAIEGTVSVGAGLVTFVWLGLTALILLYVIATWALITGVMELVAAIRLRKELHGEWLLVLSGVLSIAFAGLL